MSYKDLHTRFSDEPCHISRKSIFPAVYSVCNRPPVKVFRTSLDTRKCRGMYLAPQNTAHGFQNRFGDHVIVLARDLNYCWSRFVCVKELMHVLDGRDAATDTGSRFEAVLTELMSPIRGPSSPQIDSEIDAFWMALALLCPEKIRYELKRKKAAQSIDDLAVAELLKIPQEYVSFLFKDYYEDVLLEILAK